MSQGVDVGDSYVTVVFYGDAMPLWSCFVVRVSVCEDGVKYFVPNEQGVQGGVFPVPTASVQDVVKPLIMCLQDHGVKTDDVIATSGLTPKKLSDVNYRVPLTLANKLWALARDKVEPAIGLTLIHQYPRNHMHLVAHIAMRAKTLRDAAKTWQDHASLICDADDVELRNIDGQAAIRYQLLDPRFEDVSATEHALAKAFRYACAFTGRTDHVQEVRVRHKDPGYREKYEALFESPVVFGAKANALIVNDRHLDLPLETTDVYLREVLTQQAQSMKAARDGDLIKRVSLIIMRRILKRQDTNIDCVATQLGMSARTLSRALQQGDVTYRYLLDIARRDVTLHMMQQQKSMQEIAEFLNFSEGAALSRAFVRWCGISMLEYRKRQQANNTVS